MGALKESGLIKYEVITQPDQHGIYEIEWSYGNAKPKPSTMFPDHWSPAKVDKKIKEALKNAPEIEKKGNNRCEIIGRTSEGIKILVVVEKNAERALAKVVTAHPLMEKQT